MDADRCGATAARPIDMANISLLEVVRYFAYLNDLRVELRDGQVLFHPAKLDGAATP